MALPCYVSCRQYSQLLKRPLQTLGSLKHGIHNPFSQRIRCAPVQKFTFTQVQTLHSRFSRFQLFFKRGFKTRSAVEDIKGSSLEPDTPSLLKPFLFTVGVCGFSFAGGMIWNYEKMRHLFQKLQHGSKKESVFEKKHQKAFGFRDHANSMWEKLSSGQKMIIGIMAANLSVFLLWRIRSIQPTMIRYFTTSISHPLPSMLLSSFSHISFFHLFVNMYVLWSFATVTVNLLGFEQFAAFYLSAGTISSFASMACSKLLKRPSAVSVGASGAIMGLIGAVCVTYPNAQLGVAFISEIFPHSFSADSGLKAIVAFDVLGLVMGWRFLDHAGHLGGVLFGILYTKYGNQLIWARRETIMKWWHDLRGKP
ncbi:unnamed protein product [Lymnaea stagnalis]|uniref:rhomboid protease n=1 Tax=Lymnaea stagnalis TaxID=6523 RepID=A0AAV2IMX6_LYMST